MPIFSNTYNAFNKVKQYHSLNNWDYEAINKKVNELAEEAYCSSTNKTILSICDNGFIEECVEYKGEIYCFVSNDIYKILFNYLLNTNIYGFSLNDESYNNIHNIKGIQKLTIIDNKIGFKFEGSIINTYESFLDYCNINELKIASKTNKSFLDDFKNSLQLSDGMKNLRKNLLWGMESNPITSNDSKNIFNFIILENILIITRYQKVLGNDFIDVGNNAKKIFLSNFESLEGQLFNVANAFTDVGQDIERSDIPGLLYVLQQIYKIPNEYLNMFNKLIYIRKRLCECKVTDNINFHDGNVMINQLSNYLGTL